MPSAQQNSNVRRRRVAGQLWLTNIAITVLTATGYATQAPEVRSLGMGLLLYCGLIASAASLTLLPGVMIQLMARYTRGPWLLPAAAATWTVMHAVVFVDVTVFGIFGYHLNGLVWNALTTSGDVVQITLGDQVTLLGGAAALFTVESLAYRRLARADMRRSADGLAPPLLLRPRAVWPGVIVPCMLVVAITYVQADLTGERHTIALARIYPLYPSFTIGRMAERPQVRFAIEGKSLDYPKRALQVAADVERPNLVLIVVDSLRADMLSQAEMPNLLEFSRGSRTFVNHLSGGNTTRFGLFSLLYGLHGSYWKPVHEAQRSPVLIDTLVNLGYSIRVLSAASMNYPEFRSTAWVHVQDRVEDTIPLRSGERRDDAVARRFVEWLDERPQEQPFFTFVMLDAAHQGYSFPPGFARFEPFVDHVSYLDKAGPGSAKRVERLFNRYRNAVHYADAVVARMLDSLEARGLLASTIVSVTGDHGEEFFENGYFGHTSNFTREQVQVPFIMRGPGIEPGVEQRPTSHIDVPATLLEMVGVDPSDREAWTLGGNLFQPDIQRRRIASGWDVLAFYPPYGDAYDRIVTVPLANSRGSQIDVYDGSWRLVDSADAVIESERRHIDDLVGECQRFLKES